MPDITLPHLSGYGASSTPTGAELSEMLWSPNATPDSLNVLNGQLDKDNMASGYSLPNRVIKRGQFGRGEAVGATLNADYFYQLFDGYDTATWCQDPWTGTNVELFVPLPGGSVSRNNPYRAIPNAGKRFYVERAGPVMLSWHVFWVDDDKDAAGGAGDWPSGGTQVTDAKSSAVIRMFLDGIAQRSCYRLTPPLCGERPFAFQRAWSGHMFIENMTAGWHNAGLYLCADGSSGSDDLKQARVRARGFRVIQFR